MGSAKGDVRRLMVPFFCLLLLSGLMVPLPVVLAAAEGDYMGVWSTTAANASPIGITTDGINIWVTDYTDKAVYKYDMAGGYIGVWSTTAANANPYGITTDGTNIWVTDYTDKAVYKYDMAGGYIGVWATKAPENADPYDITTDGINIWVTDYTDKAVYRYVLNPAPTIDSTVATTAFSQNTYGWVNATVTEPGGVANLKTVDVEVNTTTLQNFTMRWTQATGVFTEESDPDGICFPDFTGGSVRENIDAYTDKICFKFIIGTLAAEGDCDVRVTVTNDDALSDIELYNDLFSYVGIAWNPIADIIDSAFALFGIGSFMAQVITYLTTVGGYLAVSFINLALLIVQQFRLILAVFGWLINGFTGIVTTILDLGTIAYSLIDGTYTAGMVNLWAEFNLASMTDVILLLLVFMWLDSIVSRGEVTPGGEIAVFIGDVSMAINISSYFMSMFQTIIESTVARVYGLIQALP